MNHRVIQYFAPVCKYTQWNGPYTYGAPNVLICIVSYSYFIINIGFTYCIVLNSGPAIISLPLFWQKFALRSFLNQNCNLLVILMSTPGYFQCSGWCSSGCCNVMLCLWPTGSCQPLGGWLMKPLFFTSVWSTKWGIAILLWIGFIVVVYPFSAMLGHCLYLWCLVVIWQSSFTDGPGKWSK